MPIIGSSVAANASSIGTATYLPTCAASTIIATVQHPTANGTPVKRALQWSHSEVFVTPYGTSLAIGSGRVADLTSVFTPSPSCVDRWLLAPTPSCGMDDTAIGLGTVWSVNPTRYAVSDVQYSNCQLYGTATYSPGVCPSGQTIAEVTAYASSALNGTKLFWQASCCKRFDTIALYLSISIQLTWDE
jgi:hypothetical protein